MDIIKETLKLRETIEAVGRTIVVVDISQTLFETSKDPDDLNEAIQLEQASETLRRVLKSLVRELQHCVER